MRFAIPLAVSSALIKASIKTKKIHIPLGSWAGMKIIAIGPKGGKIVGYGTGHKPIYAGSAAAKKLVGLKNDAQSGKKGMDIVSWLLQLGIPAKHEGDFVGVSPASGELLNEHFGVQPKEKKTGAWIFKFDALADHFGHPFTPKEDEQVGWAANAASGDSDSTEFPDLDNLLFSKQVKTGQHEVKLFTDKSTGKKWYFKYKNVTIARAEEAACRVQRLILGDRIPLTKFVTVDGEPGVILSELSGEVLNADNHSHPPMAILEKYASQVAEHYVGDWLTSNHDSHAGNFIHKGKDFKGIDKGQAWKFFGNDELTPEYSPNNSDTIYNTYWNLIKDGLIDPAEAVKGLAKAVQNAEKISSDQFKLIIAPYVATAAGYSGFDAETRLNAMTKRLETLRADMEAFASKLLKKPVTFPKEAADNFETMPEAEGKPGKPKLVIQNPDKPKTIEGGGKQPIVTDQVAGWPITKQSTTIYHPGNPVPPNVKWTGGLPGPGFTLQTSYKDKQYTLEIGLNDKGDGPQIKVFYPDGSSLNWKSLNKAGDSLYLYENGLPMDMNATKKKAYKIGTGSKSFKLSSFQKELEQAQSAPLTPSAMTPEELEYNSFVPKGANEATIESILAAQPEGLITDLSLLPPAVQQQIANESSYDIGPNYVNAPPPGTAWLSVNSSTKKVMIYVVRVGPEGGPILDAHYYGIQDEWISVPIAMNSMTMVPPDVGALFIKESTTTKEPPGPPPEAILPESAVVPKSAPKSLATPLAPNTSITLKKKFPWGKADVMLTMGGDGKTYQVVVPDEEGTFAVTEFASLSSASDHVWVNQKGYKDAAAYKAGTGKKKIPSGGGWKFWGITPKAEEAPVEAGVVSGPLGILFQEGTVTVDSVNSWPVGSTVYLSEDGIWNAFEKQGDGSWTSGPLHWDAVAVRNAIQKRIDLSAPAYLDKPKKKTTTSEANWETMPAPVAVAVAAISNGFNTTDASHKELQTKLEGYPEGTTILIGGFHFKRLNSDVWLSLEDSGLPTNMTANYLAAHLQEQGPQYISAYAPGTLPTPPSPENWGWFDTWLDLSDTEKIQAIGAFPAYSKLKFSLLPSDALHHTGVKGITEVVAEKQPNGTWDLSETTTDTLVAKGWGEQELVSLLAEKTSGIEGTHLTSAQKEEEAASPTSEADYGGMPEDTIDLGIKAPAVLGSAKVGTLVYFPPDTTTALPGVWKKNKDEGWQQVQTAIGKPSPPASIVSLDKMAEWAQHFHEEGKDIAIVFFGSKPTGTTPVFQLTAGTKGDELKATLDAFPVGYTFNAADGNGPTLWVKNDNGSWTCTFTDKYGKQGITTVFYAASDIIYDYQTSAVQPTFTSKAKPNPKPKPKIKSNLANAKMMLSPAEMDGDPQNSYANKFMDVLDEWKSKDNLYLQKPSNWASWVPPPGVALKATIGGAQYFVVEGLPGHVKKEMTPGEKVRFYIVGPSGIWPGDPSTNPGTSLKSAAKKAGLPASLPALKKLFGLDKATFAPGESFFTLKAGTGPDPLPYETEATPSAANWGTIPNGTKAEMEVLLSSYPEGAKIEYLLYGAGYVAEKTPKGWLEKKVGSSISPEINNNLAVDLSAAVEPQVLLSGGKPIAKPKPKELTPEEKKAIADQKAEQEAKIKQAKNLKDWAKTHPAVTDPDLLHLLSYLQKAVRAKLGDGVKLWARQSGKGLIVGSDNPEFSAVAHGIGLKETVNTPVGDFFQIDKAGLKKLLPDSGTVKGPDGKTYPKGTKFKKVTTDYTVEELLPKEPGFYKIKPHKTDASFVVIKFSGGGDDQVTQMKAMLEKYKVPYSGDIVKGQSNVLAFVKKADLAKVGMTSETVEAKSPKQPPSFSQALIPGLAGFSSYGEVSGPDIIPSLPGMALPRFGKAISMGPPGTFRDGQVIARRVRGLDGQYYTEITGTLATNNKFTGEGWYSGSVHMGSAANATSQGSKKTHNWEEATGASIEHDTSLTETGWKHKTDNGTSIEVHNGIPILKGVFRIRVADGTSIQTELDEAFKLMGIKNATKESADAENIHKKWALVRGFLGAKGWNKELKNSKEIYDEAWLDAQIAGIPNGQERLASMVHQEVFQGHSAWIVPGDVKTYKDAGWKCAFRTEYGGMESLYYQLSQKAGWASRKNKAMLGNLTGGASATSDMTSGGADSNFFRVAGSWDGVSSSNGVIMHPRAFLRTDWRRYSGDGYGNITGEGAGSDYLGTAPGRYENVGNSGEEIVFNGGSALEDIMAVTVGDEGNKGKLKKMLEADGITEINGVSLDDFILVGSHDIENRIHPDLRPGEEWQ